MKSMMRPIVTSMEYPRTFVLLLIRSSNTQTRTGWSLLCSFAASDHYYFFCDPSEKQCAEKGHASDKGQAVNEGRSSECLFPSVKPLVDRHKGEEERQP